MCSDKQKSGRHRSFLDPNKRLTIFQHSQVLLYKGQYVLPRDNGLPVTSIAYDLTEKEPSTAQHATAAQLVYKTIAMLQKHDIAVNAQPHGITPSYVMTYVMLGQQHTDASNNSAQLGNSSQADKPQLPNLLPNEAEVHCFL